MIWNNFGVSIIDPSNGEAWVHFKYQLLNGSITCFVRNERKKRASRKNPSLWPFKIIWCKKCFLWNYQSGERWKERGNSSAEIVKCRSHEPANNLHKARFMAILLCVHCTEREFINANNFINYSNSWGLKYYLMAIHCLYFILILGGFNLSLSLSFSRFMLFLLWMF